MVMNITMIKMIIMIMMEIMTIIHDHDDPNENDDDDGHSTISKTFELSFWIATRLQPNNK